MMAICSSEPVTMWQIVFFCPCICTMHVVPSGLKKSDVPAMCWFNIRKPTQFETSIQNTLLICCIPSELKLYTFTQYVIENGMSSSKLWSLDFNANLLLLLLILLVCLSVCYGCMHSNDILSITSTRFTTKRLFLLGSPPPAKSKMLLLLFC